MDNSGKFLVEFFDRMGNQKLFFLFWAAVVLGTIYLLMNYRKQTSKRNFRDRPYKGKWKTPPKSSKSNVPATVETESEDEDVVKIHPK